MSTLNSIMNDRIKILLAAFFIASLLYFSMLSVPPACPDPAGCVFIPPGAPILIAAEKITSGMDQDVSEQIFSAAQQSAGQQPSISGHPIKIEPYFTACLPETASQAVQYMTADARAVAAIQPACAETAKSVRQALTNAGKPLITWDAASPNADKGIALRLSQFSSDLNQITLRHFDGSLSIPREKLAQMLTQMVNP